jgi:superfamily II DNA or RNA helicase
MSKKIKLYKHQAKVVKNITRQFKKGKKHILVQSATGSGKTVIFSSIASKVSKKNKKVLIITDRIELLSQAGGTIESFNMEPFLITSGTKFIDKTKTVFIGMSQTLRNRLKLPVWRDFILKEVGLIIIDEAHKQEFNHIFKDDFLKDKFVLGFTATPIRAGKMTQLGLQYDTIVQGKPIKWLIKKGYLLNCDIYDCGAPDMSNVSVNPMKGDFSESSMFKSFDSGKLYKGLVKNYLRIAKGQKMMVFCCNVEHAIKTTKQLHKAGVNVKFISSKKTAPREPRKWTVVNEAIFKDKFRAYQLYEKYFYRFSGDRKEIFDWFKSSTDGVLVNIDIATTGFDDPTVKVIALYRATMSIVLYLQMIGRGSRVVRDGSTIKSHFTVLDFGGNKSRFGPYDVDRDWGLWHEENKTEGGVPPMKICGEDSKFNKLKGAGEVKEGCGRLIPASLKICPFCGFKAEKKTKTQEAELALSEIVDAQGVSLKMKAFRDMDFKELKQYREIKKHPQAWLWRMLYLHHGGLDGVRRFAKQYHWGKSSTGRAVTHCVNNYEN